MKSRSNILAIHYFFVIDLCLHILKICEYISFDEQKFFILIKSESLLFSSMVHAFCILFQYVI